MQLIRWSVNLDFSAFFYQGGDPPPSLARFVWVSEFVNLLTACYNRSVPVFSTSYVSLCSRVNFLHFKV